MPDRNNETRFSRVPTLNHRRSRFKMPNMMSTTLSMGKLVPIYCQEILPGDTFQIDTNKFVRMNVPVTPVMGNLYLDTYFFFVPNRLTWDHWEQFCGANDDPWVNNVTYTIPQINLKGVRVDSESLLDYFGIPLCEYSGNVINNQSFNALPIRAYGLIWNNYFRDENTQPVIPVYTGDNTVTIGTGATYVLGYNCFNVNQSLSVSNAIHNHAGLPDVNKFHGYFTSLSITPQKGPDVLIPASGYVTLQANANFTGNKTPGFGTYAPLTDTYTDVAGSPLATSGTLYTGSGLISSHIGLNSKPLVYNPAGTLGFDDLQITVNDLRLAAVMQQWEEINSRSGSRYREYLLAHYGVTSPDSRLQIPEYLGGDRIQLNMQDVEQTSQTATTPLGTFAGKSSTFRQEHSVFKSFVEHGYIIGVCCIRPDLSYSQGLLPMWNRKEIFDYYDPLFDSIGDMPVYKKELMIDDGTSFNENEVFGYKEAWAEYRYRPDQITGLIRPDLGNGLNIWTYAEDYSYILSDMGDDAIYSKEWLRQGDEVLFRSLAAGDNAPFQFIAQFYFDTIATRPMSLYSIPGLKRF